MRSATIIAASAAILPTAIAASAPGTLHLPISRHNDIRLSRRDGTATANLLNNISASAYVVQVKIGTPSQSMTLQLDTGSSDTWAPAVGATICKQGGCFYGSYDTSKSSTYKDTLPSEFSITYGDKTSAKGDYVTDTITIGDATLKQLIMGVGVTTDIAFGLAGVGYPANEAIQSTDPANLYPNLPLRLVQENITNTVAYSLWLNDLDASTGDILFGGVDTEKYHGSLTRLDLYPSTEGANVTEFIVAMTSVTAVSSSGSDKLGSSLFPMPVLLDSGTTFTNLPTDLVSQMYAEAGVTVDSSGNPLVPCKLSTGNSTFVFGFGGAGGASISVPISELVLPGTVATFSSGAFKGQNACQFAIYPASSDSSTMILGDAFLRSAYVVYDLENDQVGMAATDFNATKSNVVSFASEGAEIPNSTPAPSQNAPGFSAVAVTATQTTKLAAQAGFTGVASAGDIVQPWNGGVMGMAVMAVALMAGGFML